MVTSCWSQWLVSDHYLARQLEGLIKAYSVRNGAQWRANHHPSAQLFKPPPPLAVNREQVALPFTVMVLWLPSIYYNNSHPCSILLCYCEFCELCDSILLCGLISPVYQQKGRAGKSKSSLLSLVQEAAAKQNAKQRRVAQLLGLVQGKPS